MTVTEVLDRLCLFIRIKLHPPLACSMVVDSVTAFLMWKCVLGVTSAYLQELCILVENFSLIVCYSLH